MSQEEYYSHYAFFSSIHYIRGLSESLEAYHEWMIKKGFYKPVK